MPKTLPEIPPAFLDPFEDDPDNVAFLTDWVYRIAGLGNCTTQFVSNVQS